MDMDDFLINIGNESLKIKKESFCELFKNSIGNEDQIFVDALKFNLITFANLKKISYKYQIPYPLFFASKKVIDFQLNEFDKKVIEKFPAKQEIFYNSRSSGITFDPIKVSLIVKDISRKQLFLRKIQNPSTENKFLGFLKNKRISIEDQAEQIRNYFDIKIEEIKKLPKKKPTLDYIIDKLENRNIFVSFSSYNFMPQRIDTDLEFSGFSIKDKYYPWIFINNKDNLEKPKIFETDGRKILTIIFLICGMSKKYFSNINIKINFNYIYNLAIEVLLPKIEFNKITILNHDDLVALSNLYKVTPSLILERLKSLKSIDHNFYKELRKKIENNRNEIENKSFGGGFSYVNRYAKYNGIEFSHQIVKSYMSGVTKVFETKDILFRNRKITKKIFDDYCKAFNY